MEQKPIGGWQPIETAPRQQELIVFDGEVFSAYHSRDGEFSTNNAPVQPTHWMPLPEPPTEAKHP